ncbi:MAG TPA: AGE family epimerase/isomerase, partial [Candidatus Brocadiia bacterium]|nr:AGE family epimerase/isomerase [Candidatus Brocadiia bacterium]
PDGAMYYATTRDGRPLAPARDVYTELSTVCGFTEFARATADEALYHEARRVFDGVWRKLQTPGQAFQPFLAQTRPARVHGHSMITLNVLQELRRFRPDPAIDAMIDQCLHGILVLHRRPERRAVLELVAWDGDTLPGPAGRWVNPGHMMEAGIFVIHEGRRRRDAKLVAQGAELIEWGFDLGWDREFGGIFNDVDLDGLPPSGVEALLYVSKLWWQHAEALYALLLALRVTGDERFGEACEQVHRYAFEKFADPVHGEWFALLDRRGHRVNDAKGTARKSCYHLCRNVFNAWRLLDEWTAGA